MDRPLFAFLARVLIELPPSSHTLQSAAMIIHALSALGPDALGSERTPAEVDTPAKADAISGAGEGTRVDGDARENEQEALGARLGRQMSAAVQAVPIDELHPLGVALILNAAVKQRNNQKLQGGVGRGDGRGGGSEAPAAGWDFDFGSDRAMLQHLVQVGVDACARATCRARLRIWFRV